MTPKTYYFKRHPSPQNTNKNPTASWLEEYGKSNLTLTKLRHLIPSKKVRPQSATRILNPLHRMQAKPKDGSSSTVRNLARLNEKKLPLILLYLVNELKNAQTINTPLELSKPPITHSLI